MIVHKVGVSIPPAATEAQYQKACEIAWAFGMLFDMPVTVTRPYGMTFESRAAVPPFGVSTEGASWAMEGTRDR